MMPSQEEPQILARDSHVDFGEISLRPLQHDTMRDVNLRAASGDEEAISERNKIIRERCNYWLYGEPTVFGGPVIGSGVEWRQRRKTFEKYRGPQHSKPNPDLATAPTNAIANTFSIDTKRWSADHPRLRGEDNFAWEVEQNREQYINKTREVIEKAMELWKKQSKRALQLRKAIDSILNPGRIRKIVLWGVGPVIPLRPAIAGGTRFPLYSTASTAQHVAAISIAEQLREKVGNKDIKLYAASPGYGEGDRKALEKWFTILDAAYTRHEHFTTIDDSTLVMARGRSGPFHIIVQEYARPVAIIWDGLSKHVGRPGQPSNLARDVYWFEVGSGEKDKDGQDLTVQVPGCCEEWLPQRVWDMLDSEYELNEHFPAESWTRDQTELYDLFAAEDEDEELRDQLPPRVGYWGVNIRMYVRKD